MKQYNPSLRVDQLVGVPHERPRQEARGGRREGGDLRRAATARTASCPVKDSRSPVYPTRIAETCNHCHGDAGLMAAHKLPSDVYAKYKQSVHFETLMKKGDLSAPTCNSCHGNHGAAPPNVGSVANVCGTCHSIFADQFKASPHQKAFAELDLPGCVTCHENHAIVHPTDEFLADGAASKCSSCHEAGTKGAQAAAAMYADLRKLRDDTAAAKAMLKVEAEAGMEVSRVQFELSQADEALTKARADVHLLRSRGRQEGGRRGPRRDPNGGLGGDEDPCRAAVPAQRPLRIARPHPSRDRGARRQDPRPRSATGAVKCPASALPRPATGAAARGCPRPGAMRSSA